MNDTFDKREKKIDIAKKTILKILSELSSDATSQIKIGLRTFGEDRELDHKKDTRLVIPISELDIIKFEKALKELKASGYSPIAYSMLVAGFDFPIAGDNMIILVTDGKESCGGDPVSVVRRLKKEGLDVVINVIGYAVDKKEEDSLKEIASISSGTYNSANDTGELEKSFRKIIGAEKFKKSFDGREKKSTLDKWEKKKPVEAMKRSLIFPGLGQFYTDRPIQGASNFFAEWTMLGFNYAVTQSHEYKNEPDASFTKDFLDFSSLSFYISNSAGVYLYTKNRNNKEHYKIKSVEGTFLRSMILPGWGQLYLGDNPEAGLSYICWTGFFYYKMFKPVPKGVRSESWERQSIITRSGVFLSYIYLLQILTLISVENHNEDARAYRVFSESNIKTDFGFFDGSDFLPQLTLNKKF